MQDLVDSVKDVFFDFSPEEIERTFRRGFEVATVTIVATILLEFYSLDTTRMIYAKDKMLYLQAVVLNFINHYIYGIPVYMASTLLFLRKVDSDYSPGMVALQLLGICTVQSICYYQVHKTFHSCPGYYKYHKFHHRFHTHVTPMVANAVGLVEYLFAYIFPFALAGAIVRPYEDSLRMALYLTSFTNLLIHTPKMEAWSERNIPPFWVSTHDHMEHHKKLTVHYGAPTLNVDWAVDKIMGKKSDELKEE
jgi:sterol desaturase/sphingolipid hydroxylase (fatty acid hydroxylase superfamily)